MDIRKLQRAIVDGLEDVKAQHIAVFNTEHLSPLFERVIIASGTSNRQTKALAASVRDAVKARGMQVLRTEGEDNGEWIIVDCGAAVAHIMQPTIREYYRLEEIWGGKAVKMKLDSATASGLPKADGEADEVSTPTATRKTAATKAAAAKKLPKNTAAKTASAKKASATKTTATRTTAGNKPPTAERAVAAAATKKAAAKTPARKGAAASTASRRTAATKTATTKTAATKTAARKTLARAPAARKRASPAA